MSRKKTLTKKERKPAHLPGWIGFLIVFLVYGVCWFLCERHWLATWFCYLPPLVWLTPLPVLWWLESRFWKISIGLRAAQFTLLLLVPLEFHVPVRTILAKPEPDFKLGSFNIQRGDASPGEVAAWVQSVGLEAVCLQEANVDDRSYFDELQGLLKGWRIVREREVAFATKLPVLNSNSLPAPALDRDLLVVTVEVNGRALHILNNHFPALPMKPKREMEVDFSFWMEKRREFYEQLRREAGRLGSSFVIVGDFNTPGNAGMHRSLGSLGTPAHDRAGWAVGWTYPDKLPVTQIDHIFCGPGTEPVSFGLGGQTGSDHLAIWAGIKLK